ncbi:MAG: hypothetical protein S4CHLAM45_03070 [Chlamydiales bacterium]|nr:hypothetical protein [Chlamydiales bacterium]MCH9619165.1 hypothetical protein [Chlamydiales bacterium]MCH9622427.1 hypothetical protein [Chlamydiales bacterium]
MTEYFFLASLLPELEIGHLPPLGLSELRELIEVNIHSDDDRLKVKELLRQVDYENFRAFWAKEPFELRGNFSRDEIEQALFDYSWPNDEEFPLFLIDYLNRYHSDEERLANFQTLLSQFYEEQIERTEGFLKDYYTFQKQWRLVILGFRAKQLNRDLGVELQYEDVGEPFIAEILAQKDAKVYEPPFEYKDLKPLFEAHLEDPLQLHKALYEYQFNHMIEFWGGDLFTIDRILNYMARLIIVERFNELDMQKGIEVIDQIERNVQ